MKKRWLAVLLALVMCLSLLPVMTAAEEGEEDEASLWLCNLKRNDEDLYILSANVNDYYQGTRLNLGGRSRCAALYGTEAQIENGDALLVKLEDLEIPANLSATLIDEESVAEGLYGYAFWLTSIGVDENSYITYNGSGVRVRVSLDISISETPSFEVSGTTYDYTGEEGSPFQLYMKADDGWTITDVGGGFPPCLDFTFPENEDYIILTVDVEHQTFVFDHTFFVDVTVKNEDQQEFVVQARVRINDARPGSSTQFYTSLDFTEIAVGDGYPGEERQVYYKWRDVGEVQSFTADLWVQKENSVLEDADLSDPDTIAVLEDYGFILDIQDTYIQVNTTVGRDKKLTLVTHGEEGSEVAFYDVGLIWNSWGQGDDIPQVEIDGVEYTFGLTYIDEETGVEILGPGDGFGGWDPFLGAVINYGTDEEQPAGPEIYELIDDLTFEIVDYFNTTGPDSPCNVSLGEPMTATWNGCNLSGIVIEDDSPDGAEVKLKTSFTVNDEEFTIINCISHGADDVTDHFVLDASSLTTAAQLNRVLSSKTNFLNWVKQLDAEQETNVYNQYHSTYAAGLVEMVTFELELPAVANENAYDNIITVNTRGLDLILQGSQAENGDRTTMPGLRILRNRYPVYVQDIAFVASESITHTYGGDEFTCGVLAAKASDTNASAAGDARILDCTFTGFDYGVRSTEYGYATLNGPCQFFDCGVGYLLDTQGKGGGNGSTGMKNCVFANCDTAVQILSLHDVCSPYYWRITHCDFVNNHIDFDISAGGNFYFFRNYYGHFRNGIHSLDDVTTLNDIQYQKVQIIDHDGTTAFTNPRRVSPYNILDDRNNNALRVDNGRAITSNYIPNNESADLVMDTASLSEEVTSSGESINLSVIDKDEEVQATWTIN